MILSKDEAKAILDKIVSRSKADSASVILRGSNSNNLRFALNTVSTCGAVDSITADIVSNFGMKSGTARITSIEDEAIERGIRKSEDIAKLSPDNKEFMPPPESQNNYYDVKEFFEETDSLSPSGIAESVSYTISKSIDRDLNASGYFEKDTGFISIRNTNGLFAYHKSTSADFASTIRTRDSRGSSKIDRSYSDINLLNIQSLSDRVIDRAVLSKDPLKHEPGKYVTVLDFAAACDMINLLASYLSMRSADEGRSFFSDKAMGNKIGQKIVNEKVNIYSDPRDASAPSAPFANDGMPVVNKEWITNGTLKNLYNSRYWAKKSNTDYTSFPTNVIMKGTDKSVEDLIASVDSGIFVTRFWYMREVDPAQILYTGLTRDGVFLIEKGKLKHPINNFRFNDSPINVLNNILDMSAAEKCVGSETGNARIVVPALKLYEFNFSTISDAI